MLLTVKFIHDKLSLSKDILIKDNKNYVKPYPTPLMNSHSFERENIGD